MTSHRRRLTLALILGAAAILGCRSADTRSEADGVLSSLVGRLNHLLEPRGVRFRRALAQLQAGTGDERRRALLYLDQRWDWSSAETAAAFREILVNRLSGDPDSLVRAVAAQCLARYPAPTATRALTEALGDADEFVRLEAARSLAETADADAIAVLSRVVRKDTNPRVRAAAAQTLGTSRLEPPGRPPTAVLEALTEALRDADYAVVNRSGEALTRLTGQDLPAEPGPWEAYVRTPAPLPSTLPGP